MCKLLFTLNF